MKLFLVLALALLATMVSAKTDGLQDTALSVLRRVLELRGGDHREGDRKDDGGGEMKKPDGTVLPLSAQDLTDMLDAVEGFTSKEQGRFEKLANTAASLSDSETDLYKLGDSIQELMEGMEEAAKGNDKIGKMWMENLMKLMFAGTEDEGQCHKVLELLMQMAKEAGQGTKRQMNEVEFMQAVAVAAKEEVACIIDRFQEFRHMVEETSDAIRDHPEGNAFQAEVLMGSLFFGYQHVLRQVMMFVHVMEELNKMGEAAQGPASTQAPAPRGSLRALLRAAQELQADMEKVKLRKPSRAFRR